jgi:hypothetical protein
MVKPGLFKNAGLAELPMGATVLFAGLLAMADREGRLPDVPRLIRSEVFPMRDDVSTADVDDWLARLAEHQERFVVRYQVGDRRYLAIVNWHRHQHPHWREAPSIIPPPPGFVGDIPEGNRGLESSANLDLFTPEGSPNHARTMAEGSPNLSGLNPSESESESECTGPPKHDRRTNHPSAKDAPSTAEPSKNWLAPYLAAWDEIRGGRLTAGKAAGHLKPVDDRYGLVAGVAGWRAYLVSRQGKDAAPAYFAEDAGRWCGGARPAVGSGAPGVPHGWLRPPDWPMGQPAFTWECACPAKQHVAYATALVGTCPAKLGLRVDGFGRVAA